MKLKVIFTYDINPETGEMNLLAKEEMTVDTTVETTKSTKKSTKVDSNPEPLVTLDSNKLSLTQGAVDLLQICKDCRVDIKYKLKDKKSVPVIGTDSAFGTKGGNLLTKSNTVSYRGSANAKLSEFGTVFKLVASDEPGIYFMQGDKNPEEMQVPDEIINIEDELDALDNINFELDETELNKFEFKL